MNQKYCLDSKNEAGRIGMKVGMYECHGNGGNQVKTSKQRYCKLVQAIPTQKLF